MLAYDPHVPQIVVDIAAPADVARREVRWEPHTGARDAVRGFARIDPHGAGARMTYKLEQGVSRAAGDLVRGGAHPVVGAFVRWLESAAPRPSP